MELEMKQGAALSLPKGYQQTEIGLIPEDWSLEPIEDFASITTGGSDTQDRVDNGIYPFYVRSNTIERINKYSFDGEAILTSGDGVGVGKIFHYVTGKFDYHQRVYNIYNYRENVAGKYLFFQFSTNFYDKVMSMTAKSSVDSVRREMIADMLIPLPPTLAEQKAIATALSDVDDLISSLDALIAKKKAIKQGAMQQLLTPPHKGGKRLDGFDGEWLNVDLGNLCDLITKGTTPTSLGMNFTNEGVNFIKAESISKVGLIIPKKVAHINQKTHDLLSRSKMKENDILFTIAGVLGRIGIITKDVLPANTNQAVAIIRLRKDRDNHIRFIFHYLRTNFIMKHIEAISVQGAQANFSLTDLNNIPITIPNSLEEQKAIANVLSDIDKELQELEIKKEKYEHIKQGMMQELLTGKTRLV